MKTGIAVSIICPYPIAAVGFLTILKGLTDNVINYHSAADFVQSYVNGNRQSDIIIIDSTIGLLTVEMIIVRLSQKWPDVKILIVASGSDTFSSKSFLCPAVKSIVNLHASRYEILHAISRVVDNEFYFSEDLQYRLFQGILNRKK